MNESLAVGIVDAIKWCSECNEAHYINFKHQEEKQMDDHQYCTEAGCVAPAVQVAPGSSVYESTTPCLFRITVPFDDKRMAAGSYPEEFEYDGEG